MSNVVDQIADIRERVASIETKVCSIQRQLDKAPGGGSVVLPVAAVITILETVKVVAERLL